MRTRYDRVYDELLVMRCQDRESGAIEELVERWHKRLWRHAWFLTGDNDAAWDITQESWMVIVKGIAALHDPAHFHRWVFRIIRNKCADRIRRLQTQRQKQSEIAAETDDESLNPITDSIHVEETMRLRQAVRRLPQNQQAVLALHYLEGIGTAEMATILGVPRGTIKSRLHQARKTLHDSLERIEP